VLALSLTGFDPKRSLVVTNATCGKPVPLLFTVL